MRRTGEKVFEAMCCWNQYSIISAFTGHPVLERVWMCCFHEHVKATVIMTKVRIDNTVKYIGLTFDQASRFNRGYVGMLQYRSTGCDSTSHKLSLLLYIRLQTLRLLAFDVCVIKSLVCGF